MTGNGPFQFRQSIFLRLFLVFLLLITLPIILIETFTYTKWIGATRGLLSEQFEARFQQAADNLQSALVELESLNDLIYEAGRIDNSIIFKQLEMEQERDGIRNNTYVNGFFDEMSKRIFDQYHDDVTFSFLSMEGYLLYQNARNPHSLRAGRFSADYADDEWFGRVLNNQAINTVLVGYPSLFEEGEKGSERTIAFGQVIRNPDNLLPLGISVINVPITVFDKLWTSGTNSELFHVRASDANGVVIYSNAAESRLDLQPSPTDQATIQAMIQPYGISLEASVSERDLERPYLAFTVQINSILIGITIICLVVFVLYAVYKIKPIYALTRKMSRAKLGDFNVQMSYKAPDEIGMLSRTFNEMTGEINKLFQAKEQEYKEKLSLLRHSLENRIHPHFIYNMLDLIQYQVGEQRPEIVSDMIISLSRILRYTINSPGEEVTVAQELRWLDDYLFLQNRLYNGDVMIAIHAADDAQPCRIDKLLLQPLIENCFVHGFEDRNRPYTLDIDIGKQGNDLIMRLRDNGKGFAEPIHLMLDKSNRDPFLPMGVGLSVTIQRFLLSDHAQTMMIKSKPGIGTEIVLIQTAIL